MTVRRTSTFLVSLFCAMQLSAQITVVASGKRLTFDNPTRSWVWVRHPKTVTPGELFAAKCVHFPATDIVPETGCRVFKGKTLSTDMSKSGCPQKYGDAGWGYGIEVHSCNTHNGGDVKHDFDETTGRLRVNGDVCRDGTKRGWYDATHYVYQECPTLSDWTQTWQFPLPSKIGTWEKVATLPNPPADAQNVQYAITVNPPDTAAGLFETTPSSPTKGSNLWVRRNATNDLRITALEVTQGIQNLENEMPLIAKRRTIVRAHVDSTSDNVNGVQALLSAFRDGASLGPPILAENDAAILAQGRERMELDHAFWFQVPPAWRDSTGSVRFVVAVDPFKAVAETDEANNTREVTVTFHPPSEIAITGVPFHMHEGGDGKKPILTYMQGDSTFDRISANLLRYLPISKLTVYDCGAPIQYPLTHATLGTEWDMTSPVTQGTVLARVALVRSVSTCGSHTMNWVGLIHPKVDTVIGKDRIQGIAVPFRKSSWVRMSSEVSPAAPWRMEGGAVLAHEIGHNMGLPHVVCSGDEGFPVWDLYPHPAPNCRLAAGEDGYFGTDVYYDRLGFNAPAVISNKPDAADGKKGFPLMGYRRPEWSDPFDYCLMLVALGVACNPMAMGKTASTVTLMHRDLPAAARIGVTGSGFLFVSGVYDAESQRFGMLDVAHRAWASRNALMDPIVEPETRSALPRIVIAQLDAAGSEMTVTPAEVLSTDGSAAILTIVQVVGATPDVRGIRIRDGNKVLVQRMASRNQPQVRILTPNDGKLEPGQVVRWTASDADKDALTYTVFYSADAGSTWRPLAIGLQEQSMVLPEAGRLPGGKSARLRVEVSDGFHTAFDDSDKPLNARTWPPVPAIVQRDGLYVAVGQTLFLDAVATDIDEGAITKPESFRWVSDRDGSIGWGPELYTRKLRRGVHRITLAVRDAEGRAASTSIRVYVGVNPPIPAIRLSSRP